MPTSPKLVLSARSETASPLSSAMINSAFSSLDGCDSLTVPGREVRREGLRAVTGGERCFFGAACCSFCDLLPLSIDRMTLSTRRGTP